MRTFYESVPAKAFKEALDLSRDLKFEKLLALMSDPARAKDSFGNLCRLADITLNDLHDFWRNHQLHAGMIQMMNHVPKIMVDVAIDAESRNSACTRCDGVGRVIDISPINSKATERLCPVCGGTKEMRVVGDPRARDLIFESIGLTGKHQVVAIQQNFGLESELGDVLMASQKVITSGGGTRE